MRVEIKSDADFQMKWKLAPDSNRATTFRSSGILHPKQIGRRLLDRAEVGLLFRLGAKIHMMDLKVCGKFDAGFRRNWKSPFNCIWTAPSIKLMLASDLWTACASGWGFSRPWCAASGWYGIGQGWYVGLKCAFRIFCGIFARFGGGFCAAVTAKLPSLLFFWIIMRLNN